MTEEEKKLERRRSTLNRMAGNIAAGLVTKGVYSTQEGEQVAKRAVGLAIRIMKEVEEATK